MVSKAVLAGAAAGLGLAISGCASAPGEVWAPTWDQAAQPRSGPYLLTGGDVPAPRGALAFCGRNPDACPGEAPADAAASGLVSGAAARPAETDPMALFHALLASHTVEPGAASAPQPRAVALTRERWRMLADVNRQANRAITPVTDQELYGLPDYWALPLAPEKAPARGDCEDYVLEKRAILMAMGWPVDALSIAVAIGGQGVHAVLIAHTDRGDLLLDNVADRPRSVDRARYRWLAMQTGADMRTWRAIRVVNSEKSGV
jgi:predicted transglutaminase-like cysteine proteinase